MSNSLKDQIKEATWKLIEEHYNVDRNHPHVLTAKRPMTGNQIDKIGEDLGAVVEHIVATILTDQLTQQEKEEEKLDPLGDDLKQDQKVTQKQLDELSMQGFCDYDYESGAQDYSYIPTTFDEEEII